MTIWLVFGSWEYKRDNFFGAFSTEELAREFLAEGDGGPDEIISYVLDSKVSVY